MLSCTATVRHVATGGAVASDVASVLGQRRTETMVQLYSGHMLNILIHFQRLSKHLSLD